MRGVGRERKWEVIMTGVSRHAVQRWDKGEYERDEGGRKGEEVEGGDGGVDVG